MVFCFFFLWMSILMTHFIISILLFKYWWILNSSLLLREPWFSISELLQGNYSLKGFSILFPKHFFTFGNFNFLIALKFASKVMVTLKSIDHSSGLLFLLYCMPLFTFFLFIYQWLSISIEFDFIIRAFYWSPPSWIGYKFHFVKCWCLPHFLLM